VREVTSDISQLMCVCVCVCVCVWEGGVQPTNTEGRTCFYQRHFIATNKQTVLDDPDVLFAFSLIFISHLLKFSGSTVTHKRLIRKSRSKNHCNSCKFIL
jgi:hypothetical protein